MDANAIKPYKMLVVAMLEQAVGDVRNGHGDRRRKAYLWLRFDSHCAELCESIGLNRTALAEALEREQHKKLYKV